MTERFGQYGGSPTKGDTTMLSKTKIALATALVLGTASAALANDIDVNPSSAQSAREWREFLGNNQNAGNAYGYVVSPKHTPRASHERATGR
jgi:hypothetical protein